MWSQRIPQPDGFTVGEPSIFGPAWVGEAPGSVLEFEVEGTAISIVYYRIKGPMGMAEVQVDDKPAVRVNGWFEADWGGYSAWQLVARDLAPGKHLHERLTGFMLAGGVLVLASTLLVTVYEERQRARESVPVPKGTET